MVTARVRSEEIQLLSFSNASSSQIRQVLKIDKIFSSIYQRPKLQASHSHENRGVLSTRETYTERRSVY